MMIKTMMLFTFLTGSIFFAMANDKSGNPLNTKKWLLQELRQADSIAAVSSKAFIQFDLTQNRAGGNGSCNTFGGSLFIQGDSIQISQLFSTKMYCEAVQSVEDQFFQLLSQVNRYTIEENKLRLYKDQTVLLVFSGTEKAA